MVDMGHLRFPMCMYNENDAQKIHFFNTIFNPEFAGHNTKKYFFNLQCQIWLIEQNFGFSHFPSVVLHKIQREYSLDFFLI